MKRHLVLLLSGLPIAVAISLVAAPPAHAFIVFDPSNYAQNVLTAARSLQQINNQIRSLTNQAQSLLNQARNLTGLPFSTLARLQATFAQTRALLVQAQRLAYSVADIDKAFRSTYAPATASQSDAALIANAGERWQTSLGAIEDALKVQAGVVANLDTNRASMGALVSASQGATGALQASQAGNQLLALQAQQLADLTATMASLGRAQALEAAQHTAAQDQAREQLRRFRAPGPGYQPTAITMFHN